MGMELLSSIKHNIEKIARLLKQKAVVFYTRKIQFRTGALKHSKILFLWLFADLSI